MVVLFLLVLLACIRSVGTVGDGSWKQEKAGASELPSFTHEVNNLLLYELWKKRETNGPSEGDSLLSAVVEQVLEMSGINDVILNARILHSFRKKLYCLQKAYTKASRMGGKCVKQLLKKWETGEPYRFKIYCNEINSINLKNENDALKEEKRQADKVLTQETAKRLRVEEKLNEALEKAEKKGTYYKRRFKLLAKKVAKEQMKKKGRGPARNKKFNDYTRKQQTRIKGQLNEQCQTTLDFLGQYNFIATKVEVFNHDTREYEIFDLIGDGQVEFIDSEPQELTDSDVDDLNMWLYLKDKFNISNEAWHEIAMKAKDIPKMYGLKKRIQKLNSMWKLKETPGQAEGIQISFLDSLRENVVQLQQNGNLHEGDTIKIKLNGDGTNIGKRLSVINFAYTILNEKQKAMGEKGNYILAVIKTTESYDNLRDSLADLIHEMSKLKTIEVNGVEYKIEYFLGGDWKFLALVCGIGRANENFACIWCKCPKAERWNIRKEWPISRTIEDICTCASGKKFNCRAKPLFDFIPMDHVVIDILHLFLRISDVLIDLFIRELKRLDAIEKKKSFSEGFLRNKYKHMAAYEDFVQGIGINFHFRVNKETKLLDYRDLTGPEKLKVFQNINIPSLVQGLDYAEDIQEIWNGFINLVGDLKKDYASDDSILQLRGKIDVWFNNFLKAYQAKDVTPYMHEFRNHVPEFLKKYSNIEHFTQQGMEKYNDQASKDYFRSTNHQGKSALEQLFLKRSRMQYLARVGCERTKKTYKCSNCFLDGHTIKTCTAKCKLCQANICCAHLVKKNGKWLPGCNTVVS